MKTEKRVFKVGDRVRVKCVSEYLSMGRTERVEVIEDKATIDKLDGVVAHLSLDSGKRWLCHADNLKVLKIKKRNPRVISEERFFMGSESKVVYHHLDIARIACADVEILEFGILAKHPVKK